MKKFSLPFDESLRNELENVELQRRYDTWCSLSESDDKKIAFNDLLDSVITVAQKPTDPKLISPLFTKLSNDILNGANSLKLDEEVFLKSIITIDLLNKIVPIEKNYDGINQLFNNFWNYLTFSPNLIEHSSFFEEQFSSKKIASEFAYFFIASRFFEKFFTNDDSKIVLQYMRKFFDKFINPVFFTVVNCRKIFITISSIIRNRKTIPDSIIIDIAMFIITFYDKTAENSRGVVTAYQETGLCDDLLKLVSKLYPEIQADIFLALVKTHNDDKTPGPNIQMINILSQLVEKDEELRDQVFYRVILPLTESNEEYAKALNSTNPQKWLLSDGLKAKNVLSFIFHINNIEPDPVPACLPRLLMYMMQPEQDFKTYIGCIHLIEIQFLKKNISLSKLSDYNFLTVFVLNAPTDYLAKFLMESETFGQLAIDILALPVNSQFNESVFDSIIKTDSYFEEKTKFIQILAGFLIIASSRENIQRLMDEIHSTKVIELVQIFILSFPKSIDLPRNFVNIGGIEYLFKLFDDGLIDIITLAELFANLVYQYPINHLNFLINSLDKDHPIFKLDQKTLERVVYGLHQSLHKPIRVHALYHLLDDPGQYDPYNAWVIGKYALPHFQNIEKLPFLKNVANRWILASDFERILPFPELYEGCTDTSLDHFTLFQLFPGFGELRVDEKYTSLSFWFRFSEEIANDVTLFRNDVLMFTYSESTLTANCESQTFVTDATPNEWTHVYMILETSFKSQTIRITINRDFTFVMKPKSKINEFTFASFSTTKPGSTLFLGSALRFSSKAPKDFSLIYAAGPGFIEKSAELDEDLLVTPFELNKVDIPLNCFSVPYFGFAVHLLNNHNIKRVMMKLMQTEDPILYESIFKSLINFNIITKNYNERFWRQLLHAVKHSQIYPCTQSLIDALKTVINPKTEEYVLSTLIYGGNLWDIVDNEVLILAMFECFPNNSFRGFQDADTFLATIVQHNPKNSKIISIILQNYKKLPKTFKLIVAMLKTEAHQKIDVAHFNDREENDIQLTIVDCLIPLIDKRSIETYRAAMPFEELRYIYLTSSKRVAVRILHLIALMSTLIVDFVHCDMSFQIKTATLYTYESVWHDVMFMISGDPDCNSNMLRRPALIPLFLHLVWASSLVFIHTKSLGKELTESMKKIEQLMEVGVNFCKPYMGKIATAIEALNIYSAFYPLIINYTVVFKKEFQFPDYQPVQQIQPVVASNLSEMVDPLWSGVIYQAKDISFPSPPTCLEAKEFIAELVTEILKISGYETFYIEDVDWESVKRWVLTSPTYVFITGLLLNATPGLFFTLAEYLLLGKPYYHQKRSMHIIPTILNVMLKRGLEIQPFQYGFIFQLVQLLASLRYLNEQSKQMLELVFEFSLFAFDVMNENMESFGKFFPYIMSTILEIFAATESENYIDLFSIFEKHKDFFNVMVQNQNMENCWKHGFAVAYNNYPDELERLTGTRNPDELQHEENQNAWQLFSTKSHEQREATKLLMQQNVSVSVSGWSYEFTRRRYISDIKHRVVMLLLLTTFEYVDSTFLIYIEKRRWANFLTRKQEIRSSLSAFKPKSFHLSPRCSPFNVPKVLSPSYNEYIGDDFSKSIDIAQFNEIAIFVNKEIHLMKQTKLNLFYQSVPEFGPVLNALNCEMLRYEDPIPSILFVFAENLVILSYAQLQNNDIQLIPQTNIKQFHIFIEAVLLNHFGTTSLFLSRVMAIIPLKTILFMSHHSATSVGIWTFITGHLILSFNQHNLRQLVPYLDKINKSALDSFPFDNFLTQSKTNYEAYMRWKSRSINTYELLLSLNALSQRSFVDLNRFPVVPRLFGEKPSFEPDDFLDKSQVAGILYRILPFKYYATEDTLSKMMSYNNIPANLVCSPNCFKDLNNFQCGDFDFSMYAKNSRHFSMLFRRPLDDPAYEDNILNWISLHFNMNQPRSSSTGSLSGSTSQAGFGSTHSSPASAINPLAAKINQIKTTVINVSRRKSCLIIKNNYTNKTLYRESNSFYGLAENISVSCDGVFFVVDFAFGLSIAYKVIFSKGNPVAAQKISRFSAGAHPISSVSGPDWICATASGNVFVLWEIITGTIHRILNFDSPILALSFDEPIYYVWVASEDRITIVGINGHVRGEVEMKEKTTALTRIENEPRAICGTELGNLYLLSFSLDEMKIDVKQMNSTHHARIEKIYLQKHIKRFLSVDAHGEMAQWNAEGILEIDETPAFTSCSVCTNPTHTICQFCNKPICEQCMPKHVKGPNCLHCVAFL